MANNTIIQQGRFASPGEDVGLTLRSDVDWMRVYNYTAASAQATPGRGVEFYWQRGMAAGTGLMYQKTNATDALNLVNMTTNGFTLIDSSLDPVGALDSTVTAVSAATPPVVSAASTGIVADGDIIRLINIAGAQQLGGIDFTVGTVVADTTMELPFMATIIAGTNGSYRPITFDPIFYPRRRFVSAITAAASAVVTMTVTHGFTVGQEVRLVVPAAYGMTEMDGLNGAITAINAGTNTITLDIDSSGFTAFAFPLTAAVPFSPALVVPIGEAVDVSYANLLDDATENKGAIGMNLSVGLTSPAGAANDVIYWVAGKSFINEYVYI